MRRVLFALVFTAFIGLLSLSGCTGQGEGERCDPLADRNGDDDCAAGLVCTRNTELRWPVIGDSSIMQTPQTNICCPADRTTARVDVCKLTTPGIGSDAAIPDSAVEGSTEGGNDASTDSPSDAPSDAPTDAPTDG